MTPSLRWLDMAFLCAAALLAIVNTEKENDKTAGSIVKRDAAGSMLSLNLFTHGPPSSREESMVIVIHYRPPRNADKEPPLNTFPIKKTVRQPCTHRVWFTAHTRTLRRVKKKWKKKKKRKKKCDLQPKLIRFFFFTSSFGRETI